MNWDVKLRERENILIWSWIELLNSARRSKYSGDLSRLSGLLIPLGYISVKTLLKTGNKTLVWKSRFLTQKWPFMVCFNRPIEESNLNSLQWTFLSFATGEIFLLYVSGSSDATTNLASTNPEFYHKFFICFDLLLGL